MCLWNADGSGAGVPSKGRSSRSPGLSWAPGAAAQRVLRGWLLKAAQTERRPQRAGALEPPGDPGTGGGSWAADAPQG